MKNSDLYIDEHSKFEKNTFNFLSLYTIYYVLLVNNLHVLKHS